MKILNNSKRNSMSSTSCTTIRIRKYRKYDDDYSEFGFTSTEFNGEERPQCVLCMNVLAVECMFPSKLKLYLEANHHSMIGKPRDFFVRKLKELKQQENTFCKTV